MRPRLARRFKASAFEGSLEGQVGFGGEGGGGGRQRCQRTSLGIMQAGRLKRFPSVFLTHIQPLNKGLVNNGMDMDGEDVFNRYPHLKA